MRRLPVRDERGIVFPSPVTILSVIAVAMAGVAWFATRHHEPVEPAATPTVQHAPKAKAAGAGTPRAHRAPRPRTPVVDRSQVVVEVYNNSVVTGLAGRVAGRVAHLGWQVVGSDNWYGTIPATTVYYPPRLARAGHQLALDLGIHRTMPAVSPMRLDRLTVILTGPLAVAH